MHTLVKIDNECFNDQRRILYCLYVGILRGIATSQRQSIVPILLLAAGVDPRISNGLGKSPCTTFLEDVHYAYHDNIKIQVTPENKSLEYR